MGVRQVGEERKRPRRGWGTWQGRLDGGESAGGRVLGVLSGGQAWARRCGHVDLRSAVTPVVGGHPEPGQAG